MVWEPATAAACVCAPEDAVPSRPVTSPPPPFPSTAAAGIVRKYPEAWGMAGRLSEPIRLRRKNDLLRLTFSRLSLIRVCCWMEERTFRSKVERRTVEPPKRCSTPLSNSPRSNVWPRLQTPSISRQPPRSSSKDWRQRALWEVRNYESFQLVRHSNLAWESLN